MLVQTNLIGLGTLFVMRKNLLLVTCLGFIGASLTFPAFGAVKAGATCMKVGETKPSSSKNYLECREVAGGKLQYFLISNKPTPPPSNKSPELLSVCRLPDASTTGRPDGPSIAYPIPEGKLYTSIPRAGAIKEVIIPIDFSDSPGLTRPSSLYKPMMQNVDAWIKWYSHGKSHYEWQVVDQWIRAPLPSSEYVPADSKAPTNPDTPASFHTGRSISSTAIATEVLNVAEKYFNYKGINSIYILYPPNVQNIWSGISKLGDFQMSNDPTLPAGTLQIKDDRLKGVWISASGYREYLYNFPQWAFLLHENLHNQGLQGHAPNQGTPLGMMTNQYGKSMALNSWDSTIIDWQLPTDVYCVKKENLKPTNIVMSPLEREEVGTKSIMIRLSATQALVIESHRRDRWSQGTNGYPGLPAGFYGLVVYKVDTTKSAQYGVAEQDGAAWQDKSDGFAYYLRNQNVSHGYIPGNQVNPPFDLNFVMYRGESLTTNGVKISLVRSGDHDTVSIQKVD